MGVEAEFQSVFLSDLRCAPLPCEGDEEEDEDNVVEGRPAADASQPLASRASSADSGLEPELGVPPLKVTEAELESPESSRSCGPMGREQRVATQDGPSASQPPGGYSPTASIGTEPAVSPMPSSVTPRTEPARAQCQHRENRLSRQGVDSPVAAAAPMSPGKAPSVPAVTAPPQSQPPSLKGDVPAADVDTQVASTLDRFFSDDKVWEQVSDALISFSPATRACRPQDLVTVSFRVQVPAPYPGVQFRRSKNLGDKYPRYATNGSVVAGQLDETGDWLRIGNHLYLPTKVGTIQSLEPLPAEAAASGGMGSTWWTCCSGSGTAMVKMVPAVVPGEIHIVEDPGHARTPPPPNRANQAHPRASAASPRPFVEEEQQEEEEPSEAPFRRQLPEAIRRNPLADLDAANRHLLAPINPFSDPPVRSHCSRTPSCSASRGYGRRSLVAEAGGGGAGPGLVRAT